MKNKILIIIVAFLLFFCEENVFAEANSNGTFVIKEIKLEMVKCPAGSFIMGSPLAEYAEIKKEFDKNFAHYRAFKFEYSEKRHLVNITKPFYIGKYEITNYQYASVMGQKLSKDKVADEPICGIDAYGVNRFISSLKEKYSSSLPNGYEFSLPTEAQWEYACRAGTNTALNNDKNLTSKIVSGCSNLNEVAWNGYNSNGKVHRVGQKKPNNWGIYDMHGNVAEWCNDIYGEYPDEEVSNPVCGISSVQNFGIVRGGSYTATPVACRSAYRQPQYLLQSNNCIGLRIALIPVDNNVDDSSFEETSKSNNQEENEYEYSEDHAEVDDLDEEIIGYISAKSGINIRQEPITNSKKVGSFQYNKKVTVLDLNGPKQTLEGVTSNWYKITDGEITGWCFGGFVSLSNQ